MKKLIVLLLISAFGITTYAQQDVKKEVKVKKTSTLRQKVHNTFHKHKEHNGYKVKTKKKVEHPA